MKHQVLINSDRCIGCGSCARDCVCFAIKMKEGRPVWGGSCISCGHCEAVCPVGAVSLTGFTDVPEDYEGQAPVDPDALLTHIRRRRSIRFFKDTPVSKEAVEKIIEAGRLAPTGGNAQNISYIILDEKKEEIEAICVDIFRKRQENDAFLRPMVIDDNFFFKKAPVVIVITASSPMDAGLAAENMAFMAEALDLGVLYSGFFASAANGSEELQKILQVKAGHAVVVAMVIGVPDVTYHRTARREDADVRWL